jgi:hypothetical protein
MDRIVGLGWARTTTCQTADHANWRASRRAAPEGKTARQPINGHKVMTFKTGN